MPVIEGYNFTVNLDDRGMAKTLRTIRSEALALKNVMRSDFAAMRQNEGTLAAYSKRITNAKDVVDKYSAAIKALRKENEGYQQAERNHELSDADRTRWVRNINSINRYNVQIANLQHQMEADRLVVERLKTGIDALRQTTQAVTTSTQAYSRSLREQGQYYRSEVESIRGMRTQREALRSQLRSEVSVTGILRGKQQELLNSYNSQRKALADYENKLAQANAELAKNSSSLDKNDTKLAMSKANVELYKKNIDETKGKIAGLSERLGKNSTTLANQASQARKAAASLREVEKASSGIRSTKLAAFYRAEAQHVRNFDSAVKESTSHTREWMQKSRGAFAGVGIAIGGMVAEGTRAVKNAASIERRYIEVQNLLETSGEKAKVATARVNKMQRDGIKYSEQYGFSQKEIATQFEELARRGYSSNAALGSMNAMLKASRASGDSLADVVKVTAQAVDAFGLRTDNATKMMQRSTRVANAMASGADRTASGFQDMGVAMGYVSGSAKTVGWNVEQTAAAIGELSNRGLEGTRAGTNLRQVINSLIKPTRGAKEAFKEAGLSVDDFHTKSGKMKDVDQVFELINKHTKNMSQTDRGAFFKAVFGATGQQAAQFLSQSAEKLELNRTEINKLMNSVVKPSKAAKSALHDVNLSVKDFYTKSGKLKSVATIFEDIQKHTKGMSKSERGAFFKSVFGADGAKTAELLASSAKGLKNNRSELSQLIHDIKSDETGKNGTDYITRLANKNMKSAEMQMKILKQTALAIEATVGQALLPAVNSVGQAFGKWAVSKDGEKSIKNVSKWTTGLANTIKDNIPNVIAFGKGLTDGVKGAYQVIKPVVDGVKAIGSWVDKINGGNHTLARGLGAVIGYVGTLTLAVKGIRTVGSGILAITKDTFTFGSKISDVVKGQKGEQNNLNAELQRTNDILQKNVQLQRDFYKAQQRSADEENVINDSLDNSDVPTSGSSKEKSELSGKEKNSIERKADESYSTYESRLNERSKESKGADLSGSFKNAESAGRAGGRRGIRGMLGGMKTRLSSMSTDEKVNAALGVTFAASDLLDNFYTAMTSKDASSRASGWGNGIGGTLGTAIAATINPSLAPVGMMIGQGLGMSAAPAFSKVFSQRATVYNVKNKKTHKTKQVNASQHRNSNEKYWNQGHFLDLNPIFHGKNPWETFAGSINAIYGAVGHAGDIDYWKRSIPYVNAATKGTWADPTGFINQLGKTGKFIKNNPFGGWFALSSNAAKSMLNMIPGYGAMRTGAGWAWKNLGIGNVWNSLFGSKKVEAAEIGKHSSSRTKARGLKLPKIKLPKINLGKWWKGVTKGWSKIKWPKFPKIKMPKLSLGKWWGGIKKWWHNIKWPKLPKIKMPKLNLGKWWGGVKKWWHNIKWPKFPKIKMPKLHPTKWAKGVIKGIKDGWSGFTGWAGKLGKDSSKNLKQGWKGMKSWAGQVHDNTKKGWHGFTGWASNLGHKSAKNLKDKWKGMKSWASGISGNLKGGWHGMTSWFGSLGKNMVAKFKDQFSGLGDWMSDLGAKIQDAWEDTKKHASNLFTKGHFANGTGPLQHTTIGVLNDGNDAPEINNREGIYYPDGHLEIPSGRFVTRLLTRGTQIIKSSDLSKLLGIRHFANGTDTFNLRALTTNSFSNLSSHITIPLVSLGNKIITVNSKMLEVARKSRKDAKKRDAKKRATKKQSLADKKLPSLETFKSLGVYGNLAKVVRSEVGTGQKIYLDNNMLHNLGMSADKSGGKFVNSTKGLLKRIESYYSKQKRERNAILSARKKREERAKKREERKQKLLKEELELKDKKINARRLRAAERKAEAAERRKERKKRTRRSSSSRRSYSTRRRSTTRSSSSRLSSIRSRSARIHISYGSVRNANKAIAKLAKSTSRLFKGKTSRIRLHYTDVSKALKLVLKLEKEIKKLGRMKVQVSLKTLSENDFDSINNLADSLNTSESTKGLNDLSASEDQSSKTTDDLTKHVKKLGSHVDKTSKTIKKSKFGKHIGKQAELAVKTLGGKGNFAKKFGSLAKDSKKHLKSMSQYSEKEFKTMWSQNEKSSKSGTNNIHKNFTSFSGRFKRGWNSLQNGVHQSFGRFWSKMHSTARGGLNRVIGILNSAIGRINHVVASFGGNGNAVKTVSRLATGTGYFSGKRRAITKPTLALLNDGNDSPETQNKETVWTPSTNEFKVIQGRNVPYMLKPGEEVFNATESKHLGFTRFANGTGGLKKLYDEAKNYWKNPVKTGQAFFNSVQGLVGAINKIANGMIKQGKAQGTDWWSQLWKMVEKKVDDDDLGPASGLLKEVEKLGRGKKYQLGTWGPDEFDCSGLVSRAIQNMFHKGWGRLNVAGLWTHAHRISESDAKPGDPVFWLPNHHVGIYIGGDKYWSAFAPGAHPDIGVHSIAGSVPGVKPTFGRFNGITPKDDSKDKKVSVKTDNDLQKFIKPQVGEGFWKTIQKIADKYGSGGEFGNPAGTGMGRWKPVIRKAAETMHVHLSDADMNHILSVAYHESGGNPKSINLWDSNARAGHPSKGIIQFVDGTFDRYAYKNHRNIWNGYDQFLAMFNDVTWRRDLTLGGWGPNGPIRYANGGIARKASIFGEAGPEMAIPLSVGKLKRSRELVAQTLAALSENDNSASKLSTQIQNSEFQAELLETVKSLAEMVSQLQNKQELVQTQISVDGQILANKLDKYIAKNQARRYNNGRLNRTNVQF